LNDKGKKLRRYTYPKFVISLAVLIGIASLWLYMYEPFKIKDPTDPRFDITTARARHYKTVEEVKNFHRHVFKVGMPKAEVRKIIQGMQGDMGLKLESAPPIFHLLNENNRYFDAGFTCGYKYHWMNWLCSPMSVGNLWYVTIEFDQSDKLVEFYWDRLHGVHDPKRTVFKEYLEKKGG
jgi:hypothetical protein